MPRTGKGAKPNRTDLNTAAPAEGREFGAKTRDQEAMAAIPLELEDPIPAGGLGPLAAPTNRPDEPVTNGVALGPGRGPEARMMKPPDPYRTPLERAALQTGHPRLKALVRNRYGT